jgi:ATP-dependent helicase/nuclease subunit A
MAVPRQRPSERLRGPAVEAAKLGEIVHGLLLRLGGLAAIPPETLVRHWAETMGAPPAQAQMAATQALSVRANAAFADLFGPASRGELGFDVWRTDGVRSVGRFDRLVLAPDSVRVVEFKTAARPPGSVEALTSAQTSQMAQYVAAAGILFPGRAIMAEFIWTAAPSRMPVPQSLVQEWSRSA